MRINSFQDGIQSKNQSLLPKIHEYWNAPYTHSEFSAKKIKRHRMYKHRRAQTPYPISKTVTVCSNGAFKSLLT